MSLPVVFHELAEEELNEAAAYYGRCVPQRSTPRGGSADQFTARRNGRGRGRAVVTVGAISQQHPLPRSAGPDSSACRRTPEAPTPLLARQAMSSARGDSERPAGRVHIVPPETWLSPVVVPRRDQRESMREHVPERGYDDEWLSSPSAWGLQRDGRGIGRNNDPRATCIHEPCEVCVIECEHRIRATRLRRHQMNRMEHDSRRERSRGTSHKRLAIDSLRRHQKCQHRPQPPNRSPRGERRDPWSHWQSCEHGPRFAHRIPARQPFVRRAMARRSE